MRPAIQWYPGHIAKAEKALAEQLKRVDLILEVRDARIPLATRHPRMAEWIGCRERLLVINRVDMVTATARKAWETWLRQQESSPYFTNANQGKGVLAVAKAAQVASVGVNQRRQARGMRPRPVRAVVIGFPNVGKSALINRLLKRKVVASARKPGVTRQLRWVRVSDQMELLDAPGVLPAHLHDQTIALKLAICDDIGEAAYDNQRVAAGLLELLQGLHQSYPHLGYLELLSDRYGLPLEVTQSHEEYLHALAAAKYQGNLERAARTLLQDYRTGYLGQLPLEWPPENHPEVS